MYLAIALATLSCTLALDTQNPWNNVNEDCEGMDSAILGLGEEAYTGVRHVLGLGRTQYEAPIESTVVQSIAVATVTEYVQNPAQQTGN